MDHLLIFILAALVVAIFIVVRRYKILVYELNNSLELINNINTDCDFKESQLKASLPATSSINHAIASISNELRKQVSVINERGCEVDKKNTELEDAYVQLETSYGQLETLEQRYHSLVINIPDIVLTLDESGIITYANRACRDILNFRRHDIVGKPFNYLIYGGYAKLFNFEHLKDTVEKKAVKNGATDEEADELPRYKIEGNYKSKAFNMNSTLENMIIDFSKNRRISQKDIFEIAVVDFLLKYGEAEAVEDLFD